MRTAKILLMSLFVAGALTLTACDSDVDVREDADTTAMDVDANADTAVNAVDNAGQAISDETIETKVETKLVTEPGFDNVEVTSKPDGIIVLSGTAATEAEKTHAEEIAKGIEGVTSVENNITVAAQ